MALHLSVQRASTVSELPTARLLRTWASAALQTPSSERRELTIRIVDEAESAALNRRYRGRDAPTNVLAFPFAPPPGLPTGAEALLGDLVICAPLVAREAAEQGKTTTAHWAHLVVHGTLHLQGFDHQDAAAAARMEALETQILEQLGFATPYEAASVP